MTLATGVTLATICDFVFLQNISFVIVLRSFNKLLLVVVFSDLLISSEQENNYYKKNSQIVVKIAPVAKLTPVDVI